MPVDLKTKRANFRELHQAGCFVLPNPWDIGSARRLERMGFKALATTSAGYAWRWVVTMGNCRAMRCWSICG